MISLWFTFVGFLCYYLAIFEITWIYLINCRKNLCFSFLWCSFTFLLSGAAIPRMYRVKNFCGQCAFCWNSICNVHLYCSFWRQICHSPLQAAVKPKASTLYSQPHSVQKMHFTNQKLVHLTIFQHSQTPPLTFFLAVVPWLSSAIWPFKTLVEVYNISLRVFLTKQQCWSRRESTS